MRFSILSFQFFFLPILFSCGNDCKGNDIKWCDGNKVMFCAGGGVPFSVRKPSVLEDCSDYDAKCVDNSSFATCVREEYPCPKDAEYICVKNSLTSCFEGFALVEVTSDCASKFGKYCMQNGTLATCVYLPELCRNEGSQLCEKDNDRCYWTCKEELWQIRECCPFNRICIEKGLSEIECVQKTSLDDLDSGF